MPPLFWIGLGFAALIFVVSLLVGRRSRSGTLANSAAIGLFLGVTLAFPLIAIGLATA